MSCFVFRVSQHSCLEMRNMEYGYQFSQHLLSLPNLSIFVLISYTFRDPNGHPRIGTACTGCRKSDHPVYESCSNAIRLINSTIFKYDCDLVQILGWVNYLQPKLQYLLTNILTSSFLDQNENTLYIRPTLIKAV